MDKNIRKGYSKCWGCIKDGTHAGIEQDVYVFPALGMCLCQYHLYEAVKNQYELEYVVDISELR